MSTCSTNIAEQLSEVAAAATHNGAEPLLDTLLACGVDTGFDHPSGGALTPGTRLKGARAAPAAWV